MRVLLIGSTGVLGRAAVPRLLADGHQVTGLARNADRTAAVRALGIEPVVADIFNRESLGAALRGQEAVLNLATRVPTGARLLMPNSYAEHNRLREHGSRVLVDAALEHPDVRVIVQEGVSFGYADGGDEVLTEDSPMDVPKLLRPSVIGHENAARFAEHGTEQTGRTGVGLRIALLHGDDAVSRMLLRAVRMHLPTMPGDLSNWITVVHPEDAAAGAVAALNAPSGVYNVGANPLRRSDYFTVLAEAAGVTKAHRLPSALTVGAMSLFARSHRLSSAKLTDATGWRPERPDFAADWFPAGR